LKKLCHPMIVLVHVLFHVVGEEVARVAVVDLGDDGRDVINRRRMISNSRDPSKNRNSGKGRSGSRSRRRTERSSRLKSC